jgi:hypothetical protein
MATLEEFRAEIRAEVARRERELLAERALWVKRLYDRRFSKALAGDQIKRVDAELEKLTGIPAWLGANQRAALLKAATDGGLVHAARVQALRSGLEFVPVSEGSPTMTLYSLAQRGLMVLSYDERGRIESAQLTAQGAEIAMRIRAQRQRKAERIRAAYGG